MSCFVQVRTTMWVWHCLVSKSALRSLGAPRSRNRQRPALTARGVPSWPPMLCAPAMLLTIEIVLFGMATSKESVRYQ